MSKRPRMLVTGPVTTRSGYGAHARDIVLSLLDLDKYDIKVFPVRWGNTAMDYLDETIPHHKRILDVLIYELNENTYPQPDYHVHVVIPNEFQTWGKTYNIGITAGTEFTAIPGDWVEGMNKVDLNIVPSTFTKEVCKNTKYDKIDDRTKQKVGEVLVTKPIEVLFEGYDESIYSSSKIVKSNLTEELNTISEDFCFLVCGHWLQGEFGHDRKDISSTIKLFFDTFRNVMKKPALIIKTSGATSSVVDRYDLLKKIKHIKKSCGGNLKTLPKIYLLHGDLTDDQMNELYNHHKVKSMVSFTHGEGFGRPLLEFSTTGKPIVVSNWSGHVDFLHKDYNSLLTGELQKVPKDSFPKNIWVKDSKWFIVNYGVARSVLKNIVKNYKKFKKKSNKQKIYATNFTRDKMTEKLGEILESYLPEPSRKVDLKLPQLKKVASPKIKLPTLKKL
ncbi:MAG: hypothetical protein H8E03_01030 [Pelagibacteraceae bacterium]|nr:hypothetical protein [Pelagibacteraceae bacterium]